MPTKKKFRKAARELECDESVEGFDAALKVVAKPAPDAKQASFEKERRPGIAFCADAWNGSNEPRKCYVVFMRRPFGLKTHLSRGNSYRLPPELRRFLPMAAA